MFKLLDIVRLKEDDLEVGVKKHILELSLTF